MPYSLETLNGLAWKNYNLALEGAARVASGIDKRLNGICLELYGRYAYSCITELTTLLGGNGAFLPGTNGSYWEAADAAPFDIVGDIDIRADIIEVSPTGLNMDIISKYTPTAQQSYEWRYNGFGFDEFVWSTTGANALTDTSSQMGPGIQRFTMDVANGTDRVLDWYDGLSNDIDAGPWRTRSHKVVAGVTSIFSSSAPLRIGARGDGAGANAFRGRIARVQLRDSTGTLVANPDFRYLAPGTTTFADSVGVTWNRVGSATVS